jgi:hypothetical protein
MIFHKAAVFLLLPLRRYFIVSLGYPQCRVEIFRGVKYFDDVFASGWTVSQGSLLTDGKIGTLTIGSTYSSASTSKSWSFNTSQHQYAIIKCTELSGASWKFEAKLAGEVKSSKLFADAGTKTVDLQNDGVANPPYLGDIDEVVLTVGDRADDYAKFDYVKICEKTMLTPSDDLDVVELNVHLAVTEEVGSVNCLIQNYDAKYTDQISVGDLIEVALSRTGESFVKVFKGRIDAVAKRAEATLRGPQHYLRLRGRDLGAELFNRLVTKKYTNKEGSEIVKDVLASYTPLESVGVETTNSIYDEEEYENKSAWEIIKYIAETAKTTGNVIGFDFKCEEGNLKFFPRNKYASSVSLDGIIRLCEHETAIEQVRNKIYVFGAATKPYPLDRDAWTESLTPDDGAWSSGGTTGEVSLDDTEKTVGSYCIKHTTNTPDYYGRAIFTLNDGKEMNANLYPSISFQIKEESAFSGGLSLILEDVNGNWAAKEFNIANNKKWHFQSFMCGTKYAEEWQDIDIPNFDWKKIKKLIFDAHFSGTGTGSFWIDNLYFGRSRWSATAEDSTSQARYGLRELAIVDETLVSDDTCSKVAEAELNFRKDPAEFLRVTVIGDPRLVAGETIHVVSPNENIDADYRIQAVDHYLNAEGEFETSLTLIAEPPRLAEIISETRREIGVLTMGTAYGKLGR